MVVPPLHPHALPTAPAPAAPAWAGATAVERPQATAPPAVPRRPALTSGIDYKHSPSHTEDAMILVRTVFQVKWGKMDEVLAGMAEMRSLGERLGLRRGRVLTDLAGPMFTLVQEQEVESLDQWQRQREEMFRNPEWQAMAARMPDVFEAGRTEFYTIHEA